MASKYKKGAKGSSLGRANHSKNKVIVTKKGDNLYAEKNTRSMSIAGNSRALAEEVIERIFKDMIAKQKIIPGTVAHGDKQFVDAVARELKSLERNRVLKDIINSPFNASAVTANLDFLRSKWEEYVDAYNKAFEDLEEGYARAFLNSGLPAEVIQANIKYAKDTFGRQISESRRQEFYAYLISGQMAAFNPNDYIPHYIKGDIIIKDDEQEDVHIQLKQTGGHFKVGFQTEFFEKIMKSLEPNGRASSVSSPEDYAKAQAFMAGQSLVEEFNKAFRGKSQNLKGMSKNKKVKMMENYVATTRSDYVIIQYKGGGIRTNELEGMSITLRKDQLVDFVKRYSHLFEPGFSTTRNDNGLPNFYYLTIKAPKEIEMSDMRFINSGAFLHWYNEIEYYRKVGSRASKNPTKKTKAEKYYSDVLEPRWSEFITIHESLFGEIKYKIK